MIVQDICRILDEYYPDPSIPLDFTNAYTLLIAVILSAQCTDARVNKVTPNLWQYGTSPSDMVALGKDQIEACIRSCGLYQRKAQAIYDLSLSLIQNYNGEVPRAREALEALPGVGRKTANVILSHIFNVPAFPVDTHIMRLAHRWQWSEAKTADGVEKDLCKLFPPQDWLRRHLQLIYFGRNYCTAKSHNAELCPVCQHLSVS